VSTASAQTDDEARHIAERSRAKLPQTLAFETRSAEAFQSKSLASLQKLYDELNEATADADDLQKTGGFACACDVAHSNLLTIVGFAINKLDGEGRYQDWMKDEMLHMLDQYRSYLQNCASDGTLPEREPALTLELVKAL
jgi:hypothetical protein